jgi:hypothetical protein
VYRLWDDLAEVFNRIKADFDPTTAEARARFAASRNGAKGARKKPARKRKVAGAA